MKGFALKDGDLSITNNEIDLLDGNELTAQTIQCVLSTNKGEWLFDTNEGIDFGIILGKQRVKTTSPVNSFYQKEFATYREDVSHLAEKLQRRLDGE